MDFKKYDDFFEKYSNEYLNDASNEKDKTNLSRKHDHSIRVAQAALRIANSLELDEHDVLIEYVIALYHDLGRFVQYKKYKTYDDAKSENHALLSAKVLEENMDILKEFNEEEVSLIKKCVILHNEMKLPANLSEREKLFATIVRDADKIDGFKCMVDIIPNNPKEVQDTFYADKDEETITKLVYYKIRDHRTIPNSLIRTKTDKQLRALGFIYNELNYLESLKIVKENDYVNKIYKLMPRTPETSSIHFLANKYVNLKIQKSQKIVEPDEE